MGVSPGMQLAFIKTESNFRPTARTQRKYFLGLIPSGRISSAYGYSQALDGTWKEYKKALDTNTIEDLISHTQQTLSDGI